jgi:hypothetical protein
MGDEADADWQDGLVELGIEDARSEVKAMGLYGYEAAREIAAINGPPKRGESGWERYQACTRKERHHDRPEVMTGWMYAYRCRFCEGWHLTSKPRTGRQKQ